MIVFFDEMDSIFRTRGTGVSSDVETTVVPQLLSEIDGVEGLENVIVIGASNREDMIDPRSCGPAAWTSRSRSSARTPKRRRTSTASTSPRNCRCTPTTSPSSAATARLCIKAMIEKVVDRMYAEIDDNRFLEVTYANGDKEVMYFKDFNSGAMIQNVVDRAKKNAIKSVLETGQPGLRIQHLLDSIVDEFAENEDLPTPPIPMTGHGSRARRASGSSTSARWSPASRRAHRAPSTPSPTWVSTCSRPSGERACLQTRRKDSGSLRTLVKR